MKPTEPKFAIGQAAEIPLWYKYTSLAVTILSREWAGHIWYYKIKYSDGTTASVTETRLHVPEVKAS